MNISKANSVIKMNKVFLLSLLAFFMIPSQSNGETSDDLLDRYVKLSKENDSLKESCKRLEGAQKVKMDSMSTIIKKLEANVTSDSLASLNRLKTLRDSVAFLKADVNKNVKCERELSVLKLSVTERDRRIASLNNEIKQKEEEIAREKKSAEIRVSQSYEKGKSDAKSLLESIYQTCSLDQIIALSTKGSIERDLKLFDSRSSIYGKLEQALVYFQSLEILSRKYNEGQVADAKTKLQNIQGSKKVEKLTSLLDDYSTMANGLYEAIDKINVIDSNESVNGMGENVQAKKYAKIFGVLSDYVFGYGLNAADYPYIFDVWIQILNKKQANPDDSVKNLQLLLK